MLGKAKPSQITNKKCNDLFNSFCGANDQHEGIEVHVEWREEELQQLREVRGIGKAREWCSFSLGSETKDTNR